MVACAQSDVLTKRFGLVAPPSNVGWGQIGKGSLGLLYANQNQGSRAADHYTRLNNVDSRSCRQARGYGDRRLECAFNPCIAHPGARSIGPHRRERSGRGSGAQVVRIVLVASTRRSRQFLPHFHQMLPHVDSKRQTFGRLAKRDVSKVNAGTGSEYKRRGDIVGSCRQLAAFIPPKRNVSALEIQPGAPRAFWEFVGHPSQSLGGSSVARRRQRRLVHAVVVCSAAAGLLLGCRRRASLGFSRVTGCVTVLSGLRPVVCFARRVDIFFWRLAQGSALSPTPPPTHVGSQSPTAAPAISPALFETRMHGCGATAPVFLCCQPVHSRCRCIYCLTHFRHGGFFKLRRVRGGGQFQSWNLTCCACRAHIE